jgi:hypothetical protein
VKFAIAARQAGIQLEAHGLALRILDGQLRIQALIRMRAGGAVRR